MVERFSHRLLRNGVEGDPAYRGFDPGSFEAVGNMPGNRLPSAIRVRSQVNGVGLAGCGLQVFNDLLLALNDDIFRLKVFW